MTHLGDRIAALADGELGHAERDRALSHVAGCSTCHEALEEQRSVRALLSSSYAPEPAAETVAALLSLAAPGNPLPPRARLMPQGPVVPELPPPRRLARHWGARPDGRRPTRADSRRPGDRTVRRVRVATAGALSVAGLVLGTAFVAGGSAGGRAPVVAPVSQLSVEHGRTSTAVTVGDPGLGLMTGLTGPLAGSTGSTTSHSRR